MVFDRFLQPGCVSEECLETDIQEILRQAHVRLREFTESMGFKNGLPDQRGNQFQGANEVLLVTSSNLKLLDKQAFR